MNPRDMTGLIWLIFAAYWLFRAFSGKKTVYAEALGARTTQFVLWTLSFFFMYSDRIGHTELAVLMYGRSNLTIGIGTALLGGGLLFAVWARVHLGAYWSSTVTLKEDHVLIRSGPYGLSRHPIYTGIILGFIGTAIAMAEVRSIISFAIVLVAIAKKIIDEERLLQSHFPSDYPLYRQQVKMIIPKVW